MPEPRTDAPMTEELFAFYCQEGIEDRIAITAVAIRDLRTEVLRLRTENAALRLRGTEDSERLDWLKYSRHDRALDVFIGPTRTSIQWEDTTDFHLGTGLTLREAIDAARAVEETK